MDAGTVINAQEHITAISEVIRLAVAPVFLLTAIATLVNAMNTRLIRVVDRRRHLQDRVKDAAANASDDLKRDLALMIRRSRLIYLAILFAILAALLICVVVAGAFLGALVSVDVARAVAVCFILAMSALIVSLSLFLREVYLGVSLGLNIKR